LGKQPARRRGGKSFLVGGRGKGTRRRPVCADAGHSDIAKKSRGGGWEWWKGTREEDNRVQPKPIRARACGSRNTTKRAGKHGKGPKKGKDTRANNGATLKMVKNRGSYRARVGKKERGRWASKKRETTACSGEGSAPRYQTGGRKSDLRWPSAGTRNKIPRNARQGGGLVHVSKETGEKRRAHRKKKGEVHRERSRTW